MNQKMQSAKKLRYIWTNGVHFITKVGYDTNGNWSYWMKHHGRKRALKIQHMAMPDVSYMKLTEEMLKTGKPADQVNKSLQYVIDYYRHATGLGRN
jgi:hypothetical protein